MRAALPAGCLGRVVWSDSRRGPITPYDPRMDPSPPEHVDVLIVGAGLSGIGAGYHLQSELPGQDVRDPRGARQHRRHLGPVPLPGHPLGLGHVHARLLVQALGARPRRSPTARRSSSTSARPRASTASSSRSASTIASVRAEWSSADARWTVDGRARRIRGRPSQLTCSFLFDVHRLLPLRRGLHARRSPGAERFAGADRPPPALAGGARLRRQARRRDRQRRDRGHAGPGDGRATPRT